MSVEMQPVPVAALYNAEQFAQKYLEKGRPFDLPHSRAVVYYGGLLASLQNRDILVHTTTGWLHDIGYQDLFEGASRSNYAEIKSKKELHMIKGAYLTREFFRDPKNNQYYLQDQMNLITHLVYVHDRLEDLKTEDEILFMEADTLGAIDIERVKPTFKTREDIDKYLRGLRERRYPRFETEVGKYLFTLLYPHFLSYFDIPKEGEHKLF